MAIYNLIACPRCLSTPLMYSFAQRNNMNVLDEPFYGYYLKEGQIRIEHPSKTKILNAMELNKDKIVEQINKMGETGDVFIKGMAHHFLMDKPEFILNWKNIFLIRKPEKLILSFSKVIANPSLEDIGIKKSEDLFTYLIKHKKTPLVIDSDELKINPENYLQKICSALQIPFTKDMLTWKKGGIPEDGIWANHWYKNLHKSTGFIAQKRKKQTVPEYLTSLNKQSQKYYTLLQKHVLVND